MTKLLEVGDVIELKKGMKVYATLPEKFIYSNRPLSNKLAKTDITIGGVRKNNLEEWGTEKERLITSIQDQFHSRFGFTVSKEATEAFITEQLPEAVEETFDTSQFIGEHVVIATSLSGGSHGSFNPNNNYPDGHHVRCKQLKDGQFDPNGAEINFYQTGSFTAMIRSIEPIRKMTQAFS